MAGKVLNISLNATIAPLQKALENVGKMMGDFAATIEKTDAKMAASIRANVSEMNASLQKVQQSFVNTEKSGEKAANSGASLRQQLRAATNEANKLAESVGTSDPKFIAAARRAAELKDTMGDVQLAISALNPDEKFKGLTNVIKGGVGGIQALTGAMAAFGGESEAAQETIKKLQALMAITEGLNAIGGLADAMGAVKVQVIAAAQSMGTLKFAIAATGIGALVVAVGLLATHWDEVSLALSDASLKTEMLIDKQRKLNEEMDKAADDESKKQEDTFNKKAKYGVQIMDDKIREIEKQKELAQVSGAGATKLYQLDMERLQLEQKKFEWLAKFASQNTAWYNLEVKYKKEVTEIQYQQTLRTKEYGNELQKLAEERIKKVIEKNIELKKSLSDSTLNKPFDGLNFGAAKVNDQLTKANVTMQQFKSNISSFVPPKLDTTKITFTDEQIKRFKMMKDSADSLNQALRSVATDGIYTLADAIGTALAGGEVTFASVLNSLITMVADTAQQLGKQFITMGVAALAVTSQLFSNPVGAIAAGAALVAAGAAAKQIVKNMSAKKMEQGGVVYGNSFVNVGEYGNAHTNPEVIAPLSKLKDIIGGTGTQKVIVEGRLYGSQIALASNRNQSIIKRVTGRR